MLLKGILLTVLATGLALPSFDDYLNDKIARDELLHDPIREDILKEVLKEELLPQIIIVAERISENGKYDFDKIFKGVASIINFKEEDVPENLRRIYTNLIKLVKQKHPDECIVGDCALILLQVLDKIKEEIENIPVKEIRNTLWLLRKLHIGVLNSLMKQELPINEDNVKTILNVTLLIVLHDVHILDVPPPKQIAAIAYHIRERFANVSHEVIKKLFVKVERLILMRKPTLKEEIEFAKKLKTKLQEALKEIVNTEERMVKVLNVIKKVTIGKIAENPKDLLWPVIVLIENEISNGDLTIYDVHKVIDVIVEGIKKPMSDNPLNKDITEQFWEDVEKLLIAYPEETHLKQKIVKIILSLIESRPVTGIELRSEIVDKIKAIYEELISTTTPELLKLFLEEVALKLTVGVTEVIPEEKELFKKLEYEFKKEVLLLILKHPDLHDEVLTKIINIAKDLVSGKTLEYDLNPDIKDDAHKVTVHLIERIKELLPPGVTEGEMIEIAVPLLKHLSESLPTIREELSLLRNVMKSQQMIFIVVASKHPSVDQLMNILIKTTTEVIQGEAVTLPEELKDKTILPLIKYIIKRVKTHCTVNCDKKILEAMKIIKVVLPKVVDVLLQAASSRRELFNDLKRISESHTGLKLRIVFQIASQILERREVEDVEEKVKDEIKVVLDKFLQIHRRDTAVLLLHTIVIHEDFLRDFYTGEIEEVRDNPLNEDIADKFVELYERLLKIYPEETDLKLKVIKILLNLIEKRPLTGIELRSEIVDKIKTIYEELISTTTPELLKLFLEEVALKLTVDVTEVIPEEKKLFKKLEYEFKKEVLLLILKHPDLHDEVLTKIINIAKDLVSGKTLEYDLNPDIKDDAHKVTVHLIERIKELLPPGVTEGEMIEIAVPLLKHLSESLPTIREELSLLRNVMKSQQMIFIVVASKHPSVDQLMNILIKTTTEVIQGEAVTLPEELKDKTILPLIKYIIKRVKTHCTLNCDKKILEAMKIIKVVLPKVVDVLLQAASSRRELFNDLKRISESHTGLKLKLVFQIASQILERREVEDVEEKVKDEIKVVLDKYLQIHRRDTVVLLLHTIVIHEDFLRDFYTGEIEEVRDNPLNEDIADKFVELYERLLKTYPEETDLKLKVIKILLDLIEKRPLTGIELRSEIVDKIKAIYEELISTTTPEPLKLFLEKVALKLAAPGYDKKHAIEDLENILQIIRSLTRDEFEELEISEYISKLRAKVTGL